MEGSAGPAGLAQSRALVPRTQEEKDARARRRFPLPVRLRSAVANPSQRSDKHGREPTIENRRARHDYHVEETLECGLKLTGTEIKSVRGGEVSLQEGYVEATESPPGLVLLGTHIAEYPQADERRQHRPDRPRILLAHRREILKLAVAARAKGMTIVPLKLYFVRGRAKVLIGLAKGKKQFDKRADIKKREAEREMARRRN